MQLTEFEWAYVACALWASTDEDGNSLDGYCITDIEKDSLDSMLEDCKNFRGYVADLYPECLEHIDTESSQSGHDFWLTRNHHGAGFWDRGLGEVGRKLTEAAHSFGSSDLMVCDNGLIIVV